MLSPSSRLPMSPNAWHLTFDIAPARLRIDDHLLKLPVACSDMGVSLNGGFSPQVIHLNRVFHYTWIHFGVSLFLETPIKIWLKSGPIETKNTVKLKNPSLY